MDATEQITRHAVNIRCQRRRQVSPKAAVAASFPRSRGCYSFVVTGGER
jgi:hypothetical protein